MTREDAIYWIKNLAVLSTEKDMPQIEEALNMAIEALADRTTESTGYNLSPVEDEPQTDCSTCETYWNRQGQCDEMPQIEDEPQTDEEYINNLPWTEADGEQTDCAWKQ